MIVIVFLYMYHEITFFTGQKFVIFITKSQFLQLKLHLSQIAIVIIILEIYFVDIHVCVYSSYKESLIMLIVFVVVAVSYNLAAVVGTWRLL